MKNKILFISILLIITSIVYFFAIEARGIYVKINTIPENADVAVYPFEKNIDLLDIKFVAKNYKKLGIGPIETYLAEGKYIITIRKSNCIPIFDTIRINEKTNQFTFSLIEGFRYVYKGNYNYRPNIYKKITSFYLADKELTNEEYLEYVNETSTELPVMIEDSRFNNPRQPVIGMNFQEAIAFTEWFSKKNNVKARLPYEFEWEFAANNGDTSKTYPWGRNERNALQYLANYHPYDYSIQKLLAQDIDGFIYPAPVASFPPTDNRFYDLAGNVFEWMLDTIKAADLEKIYNDYNLGEELFKKTRLVKSGAWNFNQNLMKIKARVYVDGTLRFGNNGIRVLVEEENYHYLVKE